MDSRTFTEQNVQLAVEQLLGERDFRACATHFGELIRAGGGVQRAADFVASVVEFGPNFLLPIKNSQPLFKTYLVDVYLVYGVILCGAAVILRTFVSVLCSIFQLPELPEVAPPTGDGAGVAPLAGVGGALPVAAGKEKSA